MNRFERNTLAMAVAAACMGLCATATAQQAAVPQQAAAQPSSAQQSDAQDDTTEDKDHHKVKQLEAIAVQGFSSSLQNSIATQRNADEIVEAVSSEQIGKLPGVSIADTLGRLPGLTVQTLSGRPQVLTIHGLGPDFSTALVNGREQVSTSNNRDIQYDQYPSSWFNQVVVHLSPTANLLGQGLAGTVDMHTIRPLEQDKRVTAVNARYVWNSFDQLAKGDGVSDKGYHLNGIYVDQFADHTLGVTLGVDAESSPAQIQHQGTWGYPTTADGTLTLGGAKNYAISDQLKRLGVLGTVQFKPTDNFTSTLDMTYDNFRETQQLKGMEFPLFWGSGVTLQPGAVDSGSFVQSGVYDNVKAVVRNDYNRTRAKVYNFGWNNKWQISEGWSAEADASYSRANRRDFLVESYTGTGYNVGGGATDSIGFHQRGDGLFILNPSLDYSSGLLLTDPQGWGSGATPPVVQAGFINRPKTVDYLAKLRLGVQHDLVSGPISSVEFGVERGTRNKTYTIDQSFLILPNGATTAPIPGYSVDDPLGFMGVGPQVIYNPLTLIHNGTYVEFPTALSSIAVPPNWKVRENDLTPYLQFNISTQLGDVSLRGNVGLQVAHTNQKSEGQRVTAGNATNGSLPQLVPISGGTSYTRYLPSMNLVFGFTDNVDLRVGAARVLARPRMDQMSASIGLNTNITRLASTDPNQSYFSASGGNAKLRPTMADNYNVSLERYFGDSKGYAELSAYYLKLKDYINPNAAYLYNFADFVGAYLTPAQQQQLGTTYGIVSGPTNDGKGNVRGIQGVVNTPLGLLSPVLDGFGVIVSANITKSSITYAGNPEAITVPGLSKRVINNTLYYEHNGFEARISQNYRSNFLGEVSGISATRITQVIQGGSTYDAQVSYALQTGRFKGLTVLLQGSNLSNKKFVSYQNNDVRQTLTWEAYGRRFEFGVSYKFD
ncbi:TonB-dependent receptor [Frateuria defendens]|uniref:TonB-dependent receptor n=1 Tax=Frateuria defendens TaxID=2219559 RepID=UPI00066FF8D0|nr:TonB-dependent receptor [Frateuria defendens]